MHGRLPQLLGRNKNTVRLYDENYKKGNKDWIA